MSIDNFTNVFIGVPGFWLSVLAVGMEVTHLPPRRGSALQREPGVAGRDRPQEVLATAEMNG